MPNRLGRERSPYLLQHANNPVDWFAWGDEAFAKATQESKPIFLSIGYSTCHWCHVMEHESFEDQTVANALNRDFVAIKVDREERPDVDRVYMTFVQATTGAGGWPMSVWLTPDLKPFFGGTYFPPESRWGRPGFVDVLKELARAWRDEREKVVRSAEAILDRLREMTGADQAAADRSPVAGVDAIEAGISAFAQAFDRRHGGFGGAPKFPRPSELFFLLQGHALTGHMQARDLAIDTLRAMAVGGIRDHIGGGFHRYSVDAEWRVPHFEKMLYDQAQLVLAYLDAAQVSGDPFFAEVAEDTLVYVRRDLTSPDGGFYSAEDADSEEAEGQRPMAEGDPARAKPEKKEGAFYVWSAADVDRLLGEDAALARRRFGIEDAGNALADPQGEFRGQNILYVTQSVEDIAARTSRTTADVSDALERVRQRLFEARAGRPRPHLDDKVITAWNGLMIAAFARAARVLVDSPHRADWLTAALRAGQSVFEHLWRPDQKRLLRRYRDGEAAVEGFCEDYAFLIWGLLELFQASGDGIWLDRAVELSAIQTELFFDDRDAGWFSTTGTDASVLLRLKEDYDGAEPGAASVTVRNLLVLGDLLGDAASVERAGRTLERYGTQIGRVVRVMPFMVSNVAYWHARKAQIVIAGRRQSPETVALERAVAARYLPFAVVVPLQPDGPQHALTRLPWIAAMGQRDGRPSAYVCHDFTCQAPVTDAAALGQQLDDVAKPRRIVQS
ncbi:MAG TPA: thioredoxin domain-containing protein [Vicinamibacterales bacterium]|nr:thioredoxin domain-containing protein [Vicinamibacterales bacterium]